jgi:hypothetical protein
MPKRSLGKVAKRCNILAWNYKGSILSQYNMIEADRLSGETLRSLRVANRTGTSCLIGFSCSGWMAVPPRYQDVIRDAWRTLQTSQTAPAIPSGSDFRYDSYDQPMTPFRWTRRSPPCQATKATSPDTKNP